MLGQNLIKNTDKNNRPLIRIKIKYRYQMRRNQKSLTWTKPLWCSPFIKIRVQSPVANHALSTRLCDYSTPVWTTRTWWRPMRTWRDSGTWCRYRWKMCMPAFTKSNWWGTISGMKWWWVTADQMNLVVIHAWIWIFEPLFMALNLSLNLGIENH